MLCRLRVIVIDNTLETREKLLVSAKQEFLKNGFEKASLRVICKNAGLTTGALYFFFQNKEDIFDCLVKDSAVEFKNMLYNFAQEEKSNYQSISNSGKTNKSHLDINHEIYVMKYLYDNKDTVFLLTLKAQGSSYENYYNEIIKFVERSFGEVFQIYCGEKVANSRMVQCAIHYMVSWRIHAQLEVLQNSLNLEEVLLQAEIIAKYSVGGFENVVKSIRQSEI